MLMLNYKIISMRVEFECCKTVPPRAPPGTPAARGPAPHALTWCILAAPSPAGVEDISAGAARAAATCTHVFHEHSLFVVIPQWNYTFSNVRHGCDICIRASKFGQQPPLDGRDTNSIVVLQRTRESLTSGKRHRYIVPHPLLCATSTARALVSRCCNRLALDAYAFESNG